MPPLVAVAVNVMEAPEAAGLVPEVIAIVTAGVTEALTVIVMLLLEAFVAVAQVEFEVKSQVTTAPFVSVVVV